MTTIPDFVTARDHVQDELVRFVRALRRAGVSVPANAGTTAARALVEVGFDRERARVALRACLVTERADQSTFEDLFSEFWRRLTAGLDTSGPAQRPEDGPDGGLAPLGAETPDERADLSDSETDG
ncbi:MAG TPA: VWA containing CoxE-like protein, partial [Halococcus sp.]|nr:VWA containing CoxE-like protein [Halococcus sp.]